MAIRQEKNQGGGADLIFDGFEKGMGVSPYKGIAHIKGANLNTETGEAMCSFNRTQQAQIGTSGTLTQVNTNTVSISGLTLLPGSVITITGAGSTGLGSLPLPSFQALVVAGGGGGGAVRGGGGGAGGYQYDSNHTLTAGAYSITVGAAGAAGNGGVGGNGGNSIFDTITSTGGGGGGYGTTPTVGQNGGSGGGGPGNSSGTLTGGTGTGGQGTNGGAGNTVADYGAGGGGGSTSAGGIGVAGTAGNGGQGTPNSITGSLVTYAGGGGGAPNSVAGTAGNGGNGGGGAGNNNGNGNAATANTGGGGGGGSGGAIGGAGGTGIVIVRYLTQSYTVATGGTITTSGAYTIHSFTTNGTFTVNTPPTTNYYYLSGLNQTTGKLYYGSYPPSDPDNATAVTGITAGSATFSVTYPLGQPIMKATEKYQRDTTTNIYYRYYILDNLGSVWCHDTWNFVNWDTPVWFFVGNVGVGASGLAVLNGWITVANGYTIYWKQSTLMNTAFVSNTNYLYTTNSFHNTLVGVQGKLYGTDGNRITSIFPNTSLVSLADNVQSNITYTTALGAEKVTNGTFTGSATGWTLGGAWAYNSNAVDKNADGTTTLSQSIGVLGNVAYLVTFTISNMTVGSVYPSVGGANGTLVSSNGTYSQYIWSGTSPSNSNVVFNPTNTARFTIDNVSVKVQTNNIATVIGGSIPRNTSGSARVPVLLFTDGILPTSITASTQYYANSVYAPDGTGTIGTINIFAASSGGSALDLSTGATGNQYINTFDPSSGTGNNTVTASINRLVLPYYETATVMAELGNNLIIGGKRNALYPWNQVSGLPQTVIYLPENNTVRMLVVNNAAYVFAGNKGNIYVTNGSSVSPVISLPDYCAGIEGTPSTYVEPYFSWGDVMYCRGRVSFSILDQTASKAGNCGGIWSFIPTQNAFIEQDQGIALRQEFQNSYATYSGLASVLLPDESQSRIGMAFWSGWYSSVSAPTYGIDYSGTLPQTVVIETELVETGTTINKKTFEQIEYKLSTPLVSGDSVTIKYRQNSTDAFTTLGSAIVESATSLSGIFSVNFENGQWLQLQITLNPLASASSSFLRLKEVRIR